MVMALHWQASSRKTGKGDPWQLASEQRARYWAAPWAEIMFVSKVPSVPFRRAIVVKVGSLAEQIVFDPFFSQICQSSPSKLS